jgi:hypothetical protein
MLPGALWTAMGQQEPGAAAAKGELILAADRRRVGLDHQRPHSGRDLAVALPCFFHAAMQNYGHFNLVQLHRGQTYVAC